MGRALGHTRLSTSDSIMADMKDEDMDQVAPKEEKVQREGATSGP